MFNVLPGLRKRSPSGPDALEEGAVVTVPPGVNVVLFQIINPVAELTERLFELDVNWMSSSLSPSYVPRSALVIGPAASWRTVTLDRRISRLVILADVLAAPVTSTALFGAFPSTNTVTGLPPA